MEQDLINEMGVNNDDEMQLIRVFLRVVKSEDKAWKWLTRKEIRSNNIRPMLTKNGFRENREFKMVEVSVDNVSRITASKFEVLAS